MIPRLLADLSRVALTPEERRALGIAALTTLVTGIVGGLVAWGFEEAKRAVRERQEPSKQEEDHVGREDD
jgi:uncharacterized membrane protein YagU involved in acid resistance